MTALTALQRQILIRQSHVAQMQAKRNQPQLSSKLPSQQPARPLWLRILIQFAILLPAIMHLSQCTYRAEAFASLWSCFLVSLSEILHLAVSYFRTNDKSKNDLALHMPAMLTFLVSGPTARPLLVCFYDNETIGDIRHYLMRRRIIPPWVSPTKRIRHNLFFYPFKGSPLRGDQTLREVKLCNLSVLHVRACILGGSQEKEWNQASTNLPMDGVSSSSSGSHTTTFTKQTGRFPAAANPMHWRYIGDDKYQCLVCSQSEVIAKVYSDRHIAEHCRSDKHRRRAAAFAASTEQPANTNTSTLAVDGLSPGLKPEYVHVSAALGSLLHSLAQTYDPANSSASAHSASDSTSTAPSAQIPLIAENLYHLFDDVPMDEEQPRGESDTDTSTDKDSVGSVGSVQFDIPEDMVESSEPDSDGSIEMENIFGGRLRSTHQEKVGANPKYHPWPDRETCVLDILRHIPRMAFSRQQNVAIHWAICALGMDSLPSQVKMDEVDDQLQKLCGVQTIRYDGKLGHVYFVNDMAALIAQEMANPKIRQHLHFLPEASGKCLSETWQARRWLQEMDPALATPMIRHLSQDFFTYEPALLEGGSFCMPFRWFVEQDQIHACVWPMELSDERTSWVVRQTEEYKVPLTMLHQNLPSLLSNQAYQHLPLLNVISSTITFAPPESQDTYLLTPWQPNQYVNENGFNYWRQKANLANGRCAQVLAFPIWLYCDDTSGNMSKKWNKHNSFLFTAAGLPRQFVHRQSSIHFLCTSNQAPPLEMFDGIATQLESCQEHGIWAYDCQEQELVLLIPSVHGFLGDNPMQSEIACHIGLMGRLFCRVCKVSGLGEEDIEDPAGANGSGENQTMGYASDDSNISTGARTKPTRRSKKNENLSEMISRIRAFMEIGVYRTRNVTIEFLKRQLQQAAKIGGRTHYIQNRTSAGIKDTYLEFFTEKLFAVTARRGLSRPEKQAQINAVEASLPSFPFSPVWRIKGLDPHQDTPVEILHVILLGIVKYFWRDAVARLTPQEKSTLTTRLSSLDVSGIPGLSPLSGTTLVQYARSLIGRDFRAIAQVAPFVLHGLVSDDVFEVWKALGVLVPLVWTPTIDNIDEYTVELTRAIRHLLDCTCKVTPQWFNKPKFHILLHLPEHIQRFGPAMLFATEGFESYNAVIRSASIHSNHRAPSRDIAEHMARANRTRHLLCGGMFTANVEHKTTLSRSKRLRRKERGIGIHSYPSTSPWLSNFKVSTELHWECAGPEPRRLVSIDQFGPRHLGLEELIDPDWQADTGVSLGSKTTKQWSQTIASSLSGSSNPNLYRNPASETNILEKVMLQNGDHCSIGSWITWDTMESDNSQSTRVLGLVKEVPQLVGSPAHRQHKADGLVVCVALLGETHQTYGMPRVFLTPYLVFIPCSAPLCTANVQHACASNACSIQKTLRVRKENEWSDNLQDQVNHNNPSDLVLNTARMRDHNMLSRFTRQLVPLDREQTIIQMCERAIDARKQKKSLAPGRSVVARVINTAGGAGPSRLSQVHSPVTESPI